MNDAPHFANPVSALVANLDQTATLVDAAFLAAVLAIAWLAARALRNYLVQARLTAMHAPDWNRLVVPLLALVLVLIGRAILTRWQNVHLLNLAIPLLLALVAMQSVFHVLRHILKPSKALRAAEHIVSWLVIVTLVLHLTGYLGLVIAALDDLGFSVGRQHVSLYTVLVGLVSLAGSLMVALWLAQLLEQKLIGALPLAPNLRLAFTKLTRGLFIVLAVLIVLPLVGIDITVLSVFGGALGVGLGLGLQKIAANYVSGFTLLLEQSIRIGDMVQVDKLYGEVKRIATRYTVLRSLDGTEHIIPNETMITAPVTNRSLTDKDNLILLPIQVAYGSDLHLVRELLLDVARANDRVLGSHPPKVRLDSFGDNGINLELVVWISDPEAGEPNLRSDLNWAIWEAFTRENIEIPFPQRVIHLPEKSLAAP